jgi:hypothetical protein
MVFFIKGERIQEYYSEGTEMTHTESIIPRVLSRRPYARASSSK